jgi:carbamate kinase
VASQEERVREQLAVVAPGGNAISPPSMPPKVQVVLWFLERGGRRAVIPTPALSAQAPAGGIATQVIP